jgi:glycosyltransferase involved in cell wall biosynthesis
LRVAQLVETLGAGGAQRLAAGIADSLAARGHDAHLVALSAEGPLREALPEGVVCHDLGFRWAQGALIADLLPLPATYARLESLLRRHGIEVVQTHLPGANFCGLALAWRGVGRVYPTVHNTREFAYGDAGSRWRGSWRRWAYRRMLRDCAGVIAVSQAARDAMLAELGLAEETAERLHVVPNGVRLPSLPDDAERADARAELGVAPDAVLILASGRMTEQKNFGDLLVALAGMDQTPAPWRCLIAGDGPLHGDLVAQAAGLGLTDRVSLPGHLTDIERVVAAADIFCLPSRWEGRPLALLEAMAAGLPVVASAIASVSELVEDGRVGYLCQPGDTAGLARALGDLLADPELRHRLGAAGRTAIAAHHGWDAMIDRLEALYRG